MDIGQERVLVWLRVLPIQKIPNALQVGRSLCTGLWVLVLCRSWPQIIIALLITIETV